MRRRDLLALGLAAVVRPCTAQAQQGSVRRIGILVTFDVADPEGVALLRAFREGLQQHGWREGRDLRIEVRHSGSNSRQVRALANELSEAGVELIVTHGTPTTQAVKEAVEHLPVIFATIGDPVGAGLVASLAKPGGNLTGLSLLASDLGRKRLEMLKEILPGATRVALLTNPANASLLMQVNEVTAAARLLGLELQSISVQQDSDLAQGIEAAAESRADAIITTSDSLQVNRRVHIIERATAHRIPIIAEYREVVLAGALFSYGPSREDNWRRASTYVSRILKGEKAADLPVEQPSAFHLAVNVRTARALSIDVSSLLFRTDEVID
jgi:putative tryptophan/tyrosine transport system substrate-binding protein